MLEADTREAVRSECGREPPRRPSRPQGDRRLEVLRGAARARGPRHHSQRVTVVVADTSVYVSALVFGGVPREALIPHSARSLPRPQGGSWRLFRRRQWALFRCRRNAGRHRTRCTPRRSADLPARTFRRDRRPGIDRRRLCGLAGSGSPTSAPNRAVSVAPDERSSHLSIRLSIRHAV